ncbi:hypothetical protein ACHAW5_009059 [Stephanodiscus triporus]|uniref:Sulfotransferase domain-containing protein n=1 Tax=Stephanodiscus triporus TaxID=2934178 RepID=A0ABD3P9L6_9STRA
MPRIMAVTRHRSKSVAAVLALCGTAALYSRHRHQSTNDGEARRSPAAAAGSRRSLSVALPNGGCEITWPKKPPKDVEITYAASYPGCGARMTWNLVEALTGLETGDDWNNNGRGEEVVTVKTHYPQSNGILPEFDDRIGRVFVMIRNPMKSIPSFFNHIYEMRNHLPVHSERAPLEEWTKWRDAYLDIEIAEYKKFITYWMERYSPENRLLLTYEGLTDDLIGPEVTKALNDFLGRARGVTPIHQDSVACVWRAVVKNEPPEHQAAQFKKLQSQAVNTPPGTIQKQTERNLADEQPRDPSGALFAKEQYLRNSAIPLLSPQSIPSPPVQQRRDPNVGSAEIFPIVSGEPANYADGEGGDPFDALNEEMQKILARGKELLRRNQQLDHQNEIHEGPQPQQQQQQHQIQQTGIRNEMYQYDMSHRRLDPGHHNSQRAGPDVPRPYLPRQLDNMMNMLLEVANRYENTDVRLYHIMMGYYEQIRKERAKMNSDEPLNVKSAGGFY